MKIPKMVTSFVFILLLCSKGYSQADNSYSIDDINKNAFTFGTYETQGYVIGKYTCPEAGPQDIVSPCEHDYVIISSQIKTFEGRPLKGDELLVFVEDVSVFDEAVRYKFLIQILDIRTFKDSRTNNIKLVYFEKVEVPQEQ